MSAEDSLKQWQDYMEQLYSWIMGQYNATVNGEVTQDQYSLALADYNKRMEEAQKAVAEIQAHLNKAAQSAAEAAAGQQQQAVARPEQPAVAKTQAASSVVSHAQEHKAEQRQVVDRAITVIDSNQFDTGNQIGRAAEMIINAMNTVSATGDIRRAMTEELTKIQRMAG